MVECRAARDRRRRAAARGQRRRRAAPERSLASTARPSRRTSCSASARCGARPRPLRAHRRQPGARRRDGSRLFQEIREKRGLAYSVFSYRSAFDDTGSLGVYCGTAPERVDESSTSSRPSSTGSSPTAASPSASSTRRRATSRVRSRCRSRARRAGCTASAGPSSRMGEIPTSTRSSRRSRRSRADDVARVDRPRARPPANARSRSSVPSRDPILDSPADDGDGLHDPVGVFGAGGRMGPPSATRSLDDPELELVAAVDPYARGHRPAASSASAARACNVAPSADALARRRAPRSRSTSP